MVETNQRLKKQTKVEKMENKKNVSKKAVKGTETRKVKLNLNYVDFIGKVFAEKLTQVNKEKLMAIYKEVVKLKTSNIERVFNRSLRTEVKALLGSELKKRGLTTEQYNTISIGIIEKLSEKRSLNYAEIEG